jgi:hypothetical protein
MKYFKLTTDECERILLKVVLSFGEGHVANNKYIFDLITRLPHGVTEAKLPLSNVKDMLSYYPEICVIFDPNPKGALFRHQLLRDLEISEDTMGLKILPQDVSPILQALECDFYITLNDGRLLAVGCHEDTKSIGQRIMWCPIYESDTSTINTE